MNAGTAEYHYLADAITKDYDRYNSYFKQPLQIFFAVVQHGD